MTLHYEYITDRVSPLSCVSCVPASCVHIWFVSCPCFMSLWVKYVPAVFVSLCVNYPVYISPVFWVDFVWSTRTPRCILSLSVMPCPALMSPLNILFEFTSSSACPLFIYIYIYIFFFFFLLGGPRLRIYMVETEFSNFVDRDGYHLHLIDTDIDTASNCLVTNILQNIIFCVQDKNKN